MRGYSIHTKLIVLFIATFIFVCTLFIVFLKTEEGDRIKRENLKQENLIAGLFNNLNLENVNLEEYLYNNGFNKIENLQSIKTIKEKAETNFKAQNDFCTFTSLNYQDDTYFDLQCKNFNGLFKQNFNNRIYKIFIIGFTFFLFLMIFMYFSVLKFLDSLKKLKKQISQVNNKEKPSFIDYEDNEIGKIALEFEKALNKSQELANSRQLFLRIIMHELKTPIGKGRIISEMLKEKKQKERLIVIFDKMNSLINEFAKIEELFSKNYELQIKAVDFNSVLNQAKTELMKENLDKIIKIKLHHNPLIHIDIDFFSLLLKNMLDNALKYSNDNTCELECFENYFTITNQGAPLTDSIEYYFQAFTRRNHLRTEGMGLGLYIMNEICKLHGFEISYHYTENKHCFKVFFGEKNEA